MDSTLDIFDFDYTYRYHGNIKFESKFIMIADSECERNGAELLTEIEGTSGDYDDDFTAMGPLRNKEEWRIYLKIKEEQENDEEYGPHEEVMDVILVNQKLFDNLPEDTDEEKLDGLFWLNDSSVTVKNFNVMAFDCKYFNDEEFYEIPEGSSFNQIMYEKITDNKSPIAVSVEYGFICFVNNGDLSVYQITDSKSSEILAINIEIIPNNHMDDNKDSDSNSDIDLESFNQVFNNVTRTPFDSNINSSKMKTI